MKISKRAKSDFKFYSNCGLDMIGHLIGIEILSDPNGESAETCYFMLDTHGKMPPCREVELLARIFRAKQSVNLQIKMWAETMAEFLLLPKELQEYIKEWGAPYWVYKATMNQAAKIHEEKYGWQPTFLRLKNASQKISF